MAIERRIVHAATRGVRSESRKRERRRSALAGRHQPPLSNRGVPVEKKILTNVELRDIRDKMLARLGTNMTGRSYDRKIDARHQAPPEHVGRATQEAGITQVKFAKQVGISPRQLNRILNDGVTTEKTQLKLGNGMIGLTKRDSLYCHVDYLRLWFEFAGAKSLIKELMHLRSETFDHTDRALYGYNGTYQRGDIRVMTSDPESKLGTLLDARQWLSSARDGVGA